MAKRKLTPSPATDIRPAPPPRGVSDRPPASAARPSRPGRRAAPVIAGLLLFAVVTLVFLPTLRNGFIGYDDSLFVTENPVVQRGLNWRNVGWAFLQPVAANWHPLTTLTHMLDCQLYGLKPWGHHLTNVLLHAASAVLLFLAFRRMTGRFGEPMVLAALFALHPLRVESVAWISERKDVLSALFWMITVLAYGRYAQERAARGPKVRVWYGATLAGFACGLMSKPMLVTLPFVLLLLDCWPLKRFEWNAESFRKKTLWPLVREKVPFVALSAVASVITLFAQRAAGAVATEMPLGTRVANALVSYARYVGKLFWPADLSVFYPHPRHWPAGLVWAAAAFLFVVSAVVILRARRRPYLAVGWLWFCGTLVPVIGLVQVGAQAMADRYSYVPSIGLLLMVVWGVAELTLRRARRTWILSGLAAAAVASCCVLTVRQIGWWKDEETLWTHALAVTGRNQLANENLGVVYYNLAVTLAERGAYAAAIPNYEKAIRLDPARDDAHRSLAYAFLKTGHYADAVREYELALRLDPNDAEAHNNLGHILTRQGRTSEAIPHLQAALRLRPNYTEAHDNLGAALAGRGEFAEAAAEFEAALRLNPRHPDAREKLERARAAQRNLERTVAPWQARLRTNPTNAVAHANLGRILLDAGRLDEALAHCAEAARLAPTNAEYQFQLGVTLFRNGEPAKAIRPFQHALELDPKLAAAEYALGLAYRQQGRIPEALEHWRAAARLSPEWPDPLNNLAWALATDPRPELRNGAEAMTWAARAVQLTRSNNPVALDTLAAAYAEAGRFAEAVAAARQAQTTATAQGQAGLAEEIQHRLESYAAGRPHREEPPAR
jgi:tetratricopeptide (TPR) repeat protein